VLDLARVPDGAPALGAGWWPAESWAMGRAGRWTAGEAVLRIERSEGDAGLAVDMTVDHPSGEASGRIEIGGRTVRAFRGPNGSRREVMDIAGVPGPTLDVRIVADHPFASPMIPAGRPQGVFVHSVSLLPSPVASEIDLGGAGDSPPELVSGWWAAETWPGGPSGRWTGEQAALRLGRREAEDGLFLDVTFDNPLGITTGRIEIQGGPARPFRAANGRQTLALDIGVVPGRTVDARLVADRAFVPQRYDPSSGDGRALGFFVHSARLGSFSRCP
jgi:hypothetical protein